MYAPTKQKSIAKAQSLVLLNGNQILKPLTERNILDGQKLTETTKKVDDLGNPSGHRLAASWVNMATRSR